MFDLIERVQQVASRIQAYAHLVNSHASIIVTLEMDEDHCTEERVECGDDERFYECPHVFHACS
jgi:hypothetical protein